MSNIGELTKNENGFFMGAIDTLAVSMRAVQPDAG
jgi:uncharacterized protein (DUF736 family)